MASRTTAAITADATAPALSPPEGGVKERFTPAQARRARNGLVLIVVVLAVGTVGFQGMTGMGWINAFYFESMLASGQGPPITLSAYPNTNASEIFASFMGFISVISVVSVLVVVLTPLIAQAWREGILKAEAEARKIEKEVADSLRREKERLKEDLHRLEDDVHGRHRARDEMRAMEDEVEHKREGR